MSSFDDAIALFKCKFDELTPGVVQEFLVGENFLHENRGPDDVVWVNPSGGFIPHSGAGPVLLDDGTEVSAMLMDEMAAFDCYAWGEDEGSAKDIMVGIIRSMDRVIGWDNFNLTGYVAVTQQEEQGGYVWSGFSYVLSGSIRLIMIKETGLTTEFISDTTTGEYA